MTMNLYLPITKVDQAQRLVYGVITEESPDRSGEIMDYATSKPNFEKWSAEMEKASGGKSVGNLRAMHGKVAAGSLQQIDFDDANLRIEAVAKVVDDNEWAKVEAGVYTGFSIGGSYAKRWTDEADKSLKRYTADPSEVSLVDRPCLKTATFSMIKADGSVEDCTFSSVEPEQVQDMSKADDVTVAAEVADPVVDPVVADEAETVAKADGGKTKTEGGKKFPASDFAYVPDPDKPSTWKLRLTKEPGGEPDAGIVGAAAAALGEGFRGNKVEIPEADRAAVVAKVRRAWKKANPDKKASEMPDSIKATKTKKSDVAADLKKGMYTVATLAYLLEDLNYIQQSTAWEAEYEGDESPIPDKLKDAIKNLSVILVEMVQEETSELIEDDDEDSVVVVVDTEKSDAAGLLQKVHDMVADLAREKMEKADAADELMKADLLAKDTMIGELQKSLIDKDAELVTMSKRVEELEAMPEAPKGSVMAVEKSGDIAGLNKAETAPDPKDTLGLIKMAQAKPVKLF
jgi:hypothetical protein